MKITQKCCWIKACRFVKRESISFADFNYQISHKCIKICVTVGVQHYRSSGNEKLDTVLERTLNFDLTQRTLPWNTIFSSIHEARRKVIKENGERSFLRRFDNAGGTEPLSRSYGAFISPETRRYTGVIVEMDFLGNNELCSATNGFGRRKIRVFASGCVSRSSGFLKRLA